MPYEYFKDFAAPIATVCAALAAAFVAYRLGSSQAESARLQADVAKRNWQTANERVVLELFERRLAIYEGIRHVIARIISSGQPSDVDYSDYLKAIERVPFYFGPEVEEYFEHLRIFIIDLQATNTNLKMQLDIAESAERRRMLMTRLSDFYKEAPKLAGPYIQAHQKVSSWC